MQTIILDIVKTYTDENETDQHIEYILINRNTSIGNVFDISCTRLNDVQTNTEIYDGVTQSREIAIDIFNMLVNNLVAPEHLIDIIDDLSDE